MYAGRADGGRNPRRKALLAVFRKNPRQLAFVRPVDQLGRGRSALGIHAHVERRVVHIRKTAFSRIQLMGRDAEIKQNPVRSARARGTRRRFNIRKVCLDRREAVSETAQPRSGRRNRLSVPVDADQPAALAETLENALGMPASAHSGVNIDALRPDVQVCDAFLRQHADMVKGVVRPMRFPFHTQKPILSISDLTSSLVIALCALFHSSMSQISTRSCTPVTQTSF